MDEAENKRARIAPVNWVALDDGSPSQLRINRSVLSSTGATQHSSPISGEQTLKSALFDDIYFSGDGPEESRHVFLNGNDLARRFSAPRWLTPVFTIAETGFGVGLNFLISWELWRRSEKPVGAHLCYFSCELYPLASTDLARAHAAWPAFHPLTERLQTGIHSLTDGFNIIPLDPDITLIIAAMDVNDALQRLNAPVGGLVDAWFFDGFSPAKNPDMWRPELFARAAELSKRNATFATFTVAGAVRRAAQAAGFTIAKKPGFGRKRDMLIGCIDTSAPSPERQTPDVPISDETEPDKETPDKTSSQKTGPHKKGRHKIASEEIAQDDPAPITLRAQSAPWFDTRSIKPFTEQKEIVIIGGGIAGASMAAALRRHGHRPVILAPGGLAAGASGNRGGLIMPRLDLDDGPTARFFRSAYLYVLKLIDQETSDDRQSFFNGCGVLAAATNDDDRERQAALFNAALMPAGMIEQRHDGLYFPQAGVLQPSVFVERLTHETPVVDARAIAVTNLGPSSSARIRVDIQIDGHPAKPRTADAVVFANGRDALRFHPCRTLPLTGVAGQLEWLPDIDGRAGGNVDGDVDGDHWSNTPEHAITARHYVAPAPDGGLLVGATYDRLAPDDHATTSKSATDENLWAANQLLSQRTAPKTPARRLAPSPKTVPRAAVRCQTPDNSPVVGALPDWSFYGAAYDDLRNGVPRAYPIAQRQNGLFVLSGLGSRGLVTAPLCAEIIASLMCGTAPPVANDILAILDPARFFIRSLKKTTPHAR